MRKKGITTLLPGYQAVHKWVRERKPKPLFCESCGEEKKLQLANISGQYKLDIDDYRYLCAWCHKHYDRGLPPFKRRSISTKLWKADRLEEKRLKEQLKEQRLEKERLKEKRLKDRLEEKRLDRLEKEQLKEERFHVWENMSFEEKELYKKIVKELGLKERDKKMAVGL